ncbi:MAG: DUF4405 domain-containing protein [Raoultibacter sp.]
MGAKKNVIFDVVALVFYLVVATPALTGIAIHEWLGLGVAAVFFIHCVMHYDWLSETIKDGLRNFSFVRHGNLAIDVMVLIAFVVVAVSGILISGAVLPALGLYADGYFFWDSLHAVSAKVLLALLVVHVVAHGKWLVSMVGKGKEKGDRR